MKKMGIIFLLIIGIFLLNQMYLNDFQSKRESDLTFNNEPNVHFDESGLEESEDLHDEKIGEKMDWSDLSRQLVEIENGIQRFNFPHSVVNGHLSPLEKKELISLLQEYESLQEELFNNRYARLKELHQ